MCMLFSMSTYAKIFQEKVHKERLLNLTNNQQIEVTMPVYTPTLTEGFFTNT